MRTGSNQIDAKAMELAGQAEIVKNAVADRAVAVIEQYRKGKHHGREVSMILAELFDAANDTVERMVVDALAEVRCQASPPAGCSAADDEGRVQCPDCAKLVRDTHRIDGLYVCIDCWEHRYQVKFNMKPGAR